ncbi:MAG TPA: hypothetical protein VF821_24680 [Lentzea sp.]
MIIGQGSPPLWVPVHPARVEWIRVLLGVAVVVAGLNLPSADSPINVIGVMTTGIGAFCGVLSGLSLATATVLRAGRSSAHWSPVSPR